MVENKSYNFSCTACGGCCIKNPSMNVYDMMELSDEFIFQVSHNTRLSSVKNPLDKELLEHYQRLGHTLVLPEFNSSLFYWIEFSTVYLPNLKTCSKLVDKKCSIYHKRPSTCQLQPLEYKFPEEQQHRIIQIYKEKTEKKLWFCDFSENAPVLIKNAEIYNTHMNTIYYNQLQQIRDFTDKYIEFMNQYDGRQEKHLKTVVQAHLAKNLLVTDIVQPLFVLLHNSIITSQYAYTILQNQINLLNTEINKVLNLKIKKDIKYIQLHKKLLLSYENALKNKIFDNNDNEINLEV